MNRRQPCHRNVLRRLRFEQLSSRLFLAVTFLDSGQTLGNGFSIDVELGDLDGDGDLDAFVATAIDGPNTVWINDGFGSFAESGLGLRSNLAIESGLTTRSDAVELGDLDGDGDLDAVVVSAFAVDEIWLNLGNGQFVDNTGSAGIEDGHANNRDVALGDFDGDGDLDIFRANHPDGSSLSDGANTLWMNDGQGDFVDSGLRFGHEGSMVVAVADLDGDDDLDTFIGNKVTCCTQDGEMVPGHNTVWLNDGFGNLTDSGQLLGDSNSMSVALGDLDGDRDVDAVVGNFDRQPDRVWINDGRGRFQMSDQGLGSWNTHGVALADVDGDGDLDSLAVTWETDLPNVIWLNDGHGVFSSSQSIGESIHATAAVALGDVDGDRLVDAFFANFFHNTRDSKSSIPSPNQVWLNKRIAGDSNHDCRFDQRDIVKVLQAAKYVTGQPATFEEGDWNGDGVFDQRDLVVALQGTTYLRSD